MDQDGWTNDEEDYDEEDDFPCPECGREVFIDAEACPACGCWITEADRAAAWRAGSASGRLVTAGLWALGLAAAATLLLWLT